jgi:hypothetical protein
VRPHRRLTDEQPAGDLGVRQALCQQDQDLQLRRRQAVQAGRADGTRDGGRRADERRDQPTVTERGAPAEESFLFFAVGLLLLGIGAVPLALGLRRSGPGGGWIAVLVAAAGALVALGAAADPWHDLGLFVFFGAWIALGPRLRGLARAAAARRSRTGSVAS